MDRGVASVICEVENWKVMILDLGGKWCAYGDSCVPIGEVFARVD